MKQFRVVAETDRNYPMGLTIDGKRLHASVKWPGSACSLVLMEEAGEPALFEMAPELRQGDVWNLTLETDRQIKGCFVYGFQTEQGWLPDPYGKVFRGREIWGAETGFKRKLETVAGQTVFEWGEDKRPQIPYEDCVIYKAHVRGFTKHPSSHVRDRGTFRAVMEKIQYMKELGVTTLELMPVTEFNEVREETEVQMVKLPVDNQPHKLNYWGYGDSFLFAPKTSYSSGRRKHPDTELKTLVRELHKNNMELILELYVSGKEDPSMVLDAVRYWAREYHIDGIHLVGDAPLKLIGQDPYLSRLKLWAEYWNGVDEGSHRQLGWYNEGFLRDMRQVLKGDDGGLNRLAYRAKLNLENSAVINYMAGTNGFTLADMVSYNEKHNEANGWGNTDGADDNNSWNCGVEGDTTDPSVLALRRKMMMNACAVLMCSRGTPMFLAGDEFADTRYGNNNPYCQDNLISWLDWSLLEKNRALYEFFRYMIHFRKAHACIRKDLEPSYLGFPSMSLHGLTPWKPDLPESSHTACVLFSGYDDSLHKEDLVFLAVNTHWCSAALTLPQLPDGYTWKIAVNTGDKKQQTFTDSEIPAAGSSVLLGERSVIVFVGERN